MEKRLGAPTYDAYPGQMPEPEPEEPVDEARIEQRLARPKGKVRLMVMGPNKAVVVNLAGASLDQMNLRNRVNQAWIASAIEIAREEVLK